MYSSRPSALKLEHTFTLCSDAYRYVLLLCRHVVHVVHVYSDNNRYCVLVYSIFFHNILIVESFLSLQLALPH